jgi:hypothetical protein
MQALLVSEKKSKEIQMRFSSIKAFAVAAVLSLAVVVGASATTVGAGAVRQAPVSSEIQAYFAANGANATFIDMVQSDLRTYAGLFGSPDYMVVGQEVYSYSNTPAITGDFSVLPVLQK